MPKINDLNLKSWKEKFIKLYGDIYRIKKTFDVDDFLGLDIYGYDIYDEDGNFLFRYQTDNEKSLTKFLKHKIYRELV